MKIEANVAFALLAAGQGAMRIGEQASVPQLARARAREAWLSALFRARHLRDLDGVLGTAEAFGSLGDIEVVAQALHIADGLAALDGSNEAHRRVVVARERLLADPA